MIVHVFNSSVVSGPEILVLPSLPYLGVPTKVIFLTESRLLERSRSPVEYAKSLGLDVETIRVRSRWDRLAFDELAASLERLSPKITHAHDVKASLYLYQAKKRMNGPIPALVSTHHGAAYRKGKVRLYEEFYVRWVLPRFDLVLAVCTADSLSIARRGVRKERIRIHLNGADRVKVSDRNRAETSAAIRMKWKRAAPSLPDPEEAIFLGAVARLSPEKRHDRMFKLLHALKKSDSPGKKTVLLCFGIGPEEERLRALAENLKLADRVFWMGYSDSIGEEMAGFDAILSLSDGEGIPISLLEAGWAGTPAFATAVGGIPDLIPSTTEGYLVSKDDSDERIASKFSAALNDPIGMRQVGRAFQARVETRFSRSAWLERLRECYASLEVRQASRAAKPRG